MFRIVQESIRNIEKHSGADEASITLRQDSTAAHLVVKDNGSGFVARQPGLGLRSMEERARALSGTITIDSAPGAGTKIEVWLPLDAQEFRTSG